MGVKRIKGKGVLHEDVKIATTFRLTPLAREAIKKVAVQRKMSQAELVEEWARSLLDID